MSWSMSANGHTDDPQVEDAIVAKIGRFVADLRDEFGVEAVLGAVMYTEYGGAHDFIDEHFGDFVAHPPVGRELVDPAVAGNEGGENA